MLSASAQEVTDSFEGIQFLSSTEAGGETHTCRPTLPQIHLPKTQA